MNSQSTTEERAIISPLVDQLSVGLLSIIGIFIYLTFIAPSGSKDSLPWLLTISTVINGAHFIASYRILYSSREQVERYKAASIYVPLFLIAYILWCFFRINVSQAETVWIQSLLLVTSLYLALHYTGQAWGMMCSMGFIEKIFFDPTEKQIFKFCLKLLVIWQVIWSINLLPTVPGMTEDQRWAIVKGSYVLLAAALIGGIYAFRKLKLRTKRNIPLSMLSPYFALFFWYVLISIYPTALLGVQISHAMQYLIFPMRVEMNRHSKQVEDKTTLLKHLLNYTSILIIISVILFVVMPYFLKGGYEIYSQVIISTINIHHFYIDGCIWKITNPIVRDELFAHLPAK